MMDSVQAPVVSTAVALLPLGASVQATAGGTAAVSLEEGKQRCAVDGCSFSPVKDEGRERVVVTGLALQADLADSATLVLDEGGEGNIVVGTVRVPRRDEKQQCFVDGHPPCLVVDERREGKVVTSVVASVRERTGRAARG
jgi:hypothetical protein